MSSVETTALKLKTTPTGGVEAHNSPYYRRLVSAGYKGFLQGSIGGGALYGTFGLFIGAMIAPFLYFSGLVAGAAALALIPLATGIGIYKGATTFGQIGSTAAINAEGAELSEQRRYLLDRYYDLPDGPEGDREAAVIRQELLKRQNDNQSPEHFLHWKTVAIGAVVGAVIALAVFSPIGLGLFGGPAAIAAFAEHLGIASLFHISTTATVAAGVTVTEAVLSSIGMAFGAAAGALTGATIGIDRYYIRKWFDHTENIVHSSSHSESAMLERHHQVERIRQANQADEKTKQQMSNAASELAEYTAAAAAAPKAPVANLDKPSTKIQASDATLQRRLAEIQQAMAMHPTV